MSIIEQAKGVLAQAGGLPIDETFAVLRAYCRAHQARLTDIARRVVTGALEPANVLHADAALRSQPGS
ncbi:ANTAR domain-containing protein [Tomitella gaofuii]|uniref:ANTAR domain-containing protein n=1 Tax=Tomitella gaofuii TaxID=2760083 RepID=UPI0015FBAFED|nr:ANTAR domain-containing protein [Tomitella gaofuii]